MISISTIRDDRGYLLLEILTAITLAGIILTSVSPIVRAVIYSRKTLAKNVEETFAVSRLFTVIASAFDRASSHRFVIPPRIHRAGRITYRSEYGSKEKIHPIVEHAKFAPSSNSDAVTFLGSVLYATRIASLDTMEPRVEADRVIIKLYSCPEYKNSESYRRFILVTLQGLFEAILLEPVTLSPNECGNGIFVLTQSISLNPPFLESESLNKTLRMSRLLLVPIDSHLTIYLDTSGQVRLLNHYGDTTVENQSMLNNIEMINFDIIGNELKFSVKPKGGKLLSHNLLMLLPQRGHLNFLFSFLSAVNEK
jgi:hypothetical protein